MEPAKNLEVQKSDSLYTYENGNDISASAGCISVRNTMQATALVASSFNSKPGTLYASK